MKVEELISELQALMVAQYHTHLCGSGEDCILGGSKESCNVAGFIGPFPSAHTNLMCYWIVVPRSCHEPLTICAGGWNPDELRIK